MRLPTAVLLGALWPAAALAQASGDAGATTLESIAPPSPHEGDLWTRDALTGDWGGARSKLEGKGILLAADSIDEVLGNPTGGTRRGAIYEGRLELLATINLQKLLSWPDATFHANAYQIHGRGLSGNDLGGNLMTASNIEATRATRLFDLWIEQILFGGAASIRAGQIAADDEFFTSQYAANLINGTFGWPAILATDLPSGGPAYPLAAPGLRINLAPGKETTLSAAVFNGDPAGAGPGNPQLRDASGTSFRVNDGAFAIAEASYAVNQNSNSPGQPATYKLGAWYHSGVFADERFDTAGQSLASPSTTGIARRHTGDYGVYAVIDRGLWHDSGAGRALGVFLRLGATPSDRNLVAFYADMGLNFKGVVAARSDDMLGLAVAVAPISAAASALDRDQRHYSAINTPIGDAETVVEATYRVQVTPWWTLQPDLQFIRHPGGHVAPSNQPTKPIPNAFVMGMRSAVLF